mmetsp:Transcript_49676/g.141927  ORF Transcript_49676/g.141927 Transcript_49676/m.141927 type:complete len:417 (-) Transcript_49676:108-1358(-)
MPPGAAGSAFEVGPSVKRYGVGISWDESHTVVDIDLQAVVVNDKGQIIDAVYYNNLKALKASITHSGDEQTGEKSGIDECIWITFQKLPQHVKLILFVVAAYNRGCLRDARNGRVHLLEERKDNEVGSFAMEDSAAEVDAICMMVRESSHWVLRVLDEPAQEGRHFVDIVEPTLGNLIRGVIPGAPKRQKVAFAMEKGEVLDLQDSNHMTLVRAGLGWDVDPKAGDVDLDVSVVLFAQGGKEIGAVFFGNLAEFGVEHSGDNLTGEGAGDDEVITVSLDQIPADCDQLVFVVNIYSKGTTFDRVSNAFCRIMDQEGSELAKYMLREGRGESGLAIARLFREPGGRWGFQALGTFCRGRTWKDSVPELKSICQRGARDFQLRGQTTMTLHAGPAVDTNQVVLAEPVADAKGSCCALQ